MDDYKTTFEARGHEYNKASHLCPDARRNEINRTIEPVSFRPGQVILDAPAGGGCVADAAWARAGAGSRMVCVEPSPRFAQAIAGPYQVLHQDIDKVALPDGSVDVILSLAGLHHIADRRSVYAEWHRLLAPGGQLVVADVADNTATGTFLNTFVDKYTPGGHRGVFIYDDEFEDGLTRAGLVVTDCTLEEVPWEFADRQLLGSYCWTLFAALKTSPAAVADAMADIVGLSPMANGGIAIDWQLKYATAFKA